jgi:hypothetical protein
VALSWQDIGSIAQCVETIIILGAFIYAAIQVREVKKSRHLAAVKDLLNEIGNSEVQAHRYWVLNEMSLCDPAKIAAIGEDELIRVRRISVAYDRVGYLLKLGLLPERELFELQQDEIPKLWMKLKPVIEHIRTVERRPNYCRHFSYLAEDWFERMQSTRWSRLLKSDRRLDEKDKKAMLP